jgi:FAD-dependent monooxygenase
MTHTICIPVLGVGGGPTGLILAAALSREGIGCVLAERNTHTTPFPTMDVINRPSMELLRRLGADEELRRVGVAAQHSFDVIFAPGLNGPEIARWRLPSVNEHNVIHLPARPNPVRGR